MRKYFCVAVPESFDWAAKHPVIVITIGELGYEEGGRGEDLPEEVIESAISASMFGWDKPCAKAALDYANK